MTSMRRWIVLPLLALATVLAAPAYAEKGRGGGDRFDVRGRDDDRRLERELRFGRERDRGEDRRGRGRDDERESRGHRLSPEERLRLRQDIDEFGREIYIERRRR